MQIDESKANDSNYISGLKARKEELVEHLADLRMLHRKFENVAFHAALYDAISMMEQDIKIIGEFLFWHGGDYTRIRNSIYREILRDFKKKVKNDE